MDDWIDYYNSTHTIYVSKLHRDVHFDEIARDIVGYIASPDAVVLDYACGEALSAAKVADACGKLILAEPAPGVRGRLIARFAPIPKIKVRSLDDLQAHAERQSVDLVVMNSVAQYMTPAELDARAGADPPAAEPLRQTGARRHPAAGCRHGPRRDRAAAAGRDSHGFLQDALWGLARTALSDYRQLAHQDRAAALQRSRDARQAHRRRLPAGPRRRNIGHNPWRMTFVAKRAG